MEVPREICFLHLEFPKQLVIVWLETWNGEPKMQIPQMHVSVESSILSFLVKKWMAFSQNLGYSKWSAFYGLRLSDMKTVYKQNSYKFHSNKHGNEIQKI